MPMIEIDALAARLSLGDKDYDRRHTLFERSLIGESPDDILRFHDDLVAEASARCQREPIPQGIMRSFDHGHSDLLEATPTGALRRLDAFNRWHLGFHAHAALCGFPRDDPDSADDPNGTGCTAEFHDDMGIWVEGNMGTHFLYDVIPLAYEKAAGHLWPRGVRMRGSGQPLLEFTNPRQDGNGRAPSPLRDYWSRLEEHADQVNDSEEWWAWLRTTDVRQFTLDCGSRDWYGARRRKSGTYSRTVRSPRPFLRRGCHLILGLTPDENAILALTVDEATARATTDFEDVFRAAADHLGVADPPELAG